MLRTRVQRRRAAVLPAHGEHGGAAPTVIVGHSFAMASSACVNRPRTVQLHTARRSGESHDPVEQRAQAQAPRRKDQQWSS